MTHLRLVSSRRNYGPSPARSVRPSSKSLTGSMQHTRIVRMEGNLLQLAVTRPIAFDVLEQWISNLIAEGRVGIMHKR